MAYNVQSVQEWYTAGTTYVAQQLSDRNEFVQGIALYRKVFYDYYREKKSTT